MNRRIVILTSVGIVALVTVNGVAIRKVIKSRGGASSIPRLNSGKFKRVGRGQYTAK